MDAEQVKTFIEPGYKNVFGFQTAKIRKLAQDNLTALYAAVVAEVERCGGDPENPKDQDRANINLIGLLQDSDKAKDQAIKYGLAILAE
jgi:hypothetical protein